jgi:cell division protein FtsQ
VRNSDLRQHCFASTPEPAFRKKRLSLRKVRNKILQNRRSRKDSYAPETKRVARRFRLLPAVGTLLVVTLFFVADGPGRICSIFSNIGIFKVRVLEFSGCESTSKDRLRLLTGINLYQTSLLGLDKESIADLVEKDPWVSKAVVKRDWPSAILIEVVEHTPIAMMITHTTDEPRLYYIDKKGTSFLEVSSGHDVDYPVITGLDRFTDEQKRTEVFQDIYRFLQLVGRNNPNLPAQSVSEIHINGEGEMVVYLVDYTFPIFFGRGEVTAKYNRLVSVLGELYKEKRKGLLISGIEYIRMDYLNDKVLVAQSESG